MFYNYLTITLRHFWKHSIYSLVNIVGLTMGVSSALFLFLYVRSELSFDQHFDDADQIYRLTMQAQFIDSETKAALTPGGLGTAVMAREPGIKSVAAFSSIKGQTLVAEDNKFPQDAIFLATEDLFQVFSIPLIAGNRATALRLSHSIVLSKSLADKMFPDKEALNQTVTTPWGDCQVTAIYQDLPENTHFHAEAFISVETTGSPVHYDQIWDQNDFYTYVLMDDSFDPQQLLATLNEVALEKATPIYEKQNASVQFHMQPLTDIHLKSHLDFEVEANSYMTYVYIFSSLAVLMLLIACINYMNLATARATQRATEIGVRKTMGSSTGQLIGQFLYESYLMAVVAVSISLGLFMMLLPWFNQFSGLHLTAAILLQPDVLAGVAIVLVLLGGFSGMYPAWYLSRLPPMKALQNNKRLFGTWNVSVRQGLVMVQFAIATFMLINTFIVYEQFQYMLSSSLGFDREQVIRIKLNRGESLEHLSALTSEMGQLAGITNIASANQSPGDKVKRDYFAFETDEGEATHLTQWMTIDHAVVPTLGLSIQSGTNISDHAQPRQVTGEPQNITGRQVLVNESLVRQMGWTAENAVGRTVRILPLDENWKAEVKGVIRDFHFSSLHASIQPMMMINMVPANELMLVKVQADQIGQTLNRMQEVYQRVVGNQRMDYAFLDTHFEAQYAADQIRKQLLTLFSALTILVACLGLFGLASLTASQRTKEIGIRKVMGASVWSILVLLSREYIRLILLALVISIPVANYFIGEWLNNFAYQIVLRWWYFAIPGLLVLTVALLSVSQRTVKAAHHNPVDSLRYE